MGGKMNIMSKRFLVTWHKEEPYDEPHMVVLDEAGLRQHLVTAALHELGSPRVFFLDDDGVLHRLFHQNRAVVSHAEDDGVDFVYTIGLDRDVPGATQEETEVSYTIPGDI